MHGSCSSRLPSEALLLDCSPWNVAILFLLLPHGDVWATSYFIYFCCMPTSDTPLLPATAYYFSYLFLSRCQQTSPHESHAPHDFCPWQSKGMSWCPRFSNVWILGYLTGWLNLIIWIIGKKNIMREDQRCNSCLFLVQERNATWYSEEDAGKQSLNSSIFTYPKVSLFIN